MTDDLDPAAVARRARALARALGDQPAASGMTGSGLSPDDVEAIRREMVALAKENLRLREHDRAQEERLSQMRLSEATLAERVAWRVKVTWHAAGIIEGAAAAVILRYLFG